MRSYLSRLTSEFKSEYIYLYYIIEFHPLNTQHTRMYDVHPKKHTEPHYARWSNKPHTEHSNYYFNSHLRSCWLGHSEDEINEEFTNFLFFVEFHPFLSRSILLLLSYRIVSVVSAFSFAFFGIAIRTVCTVAHRQRPFSLVLCWCWCRCCCHSFRWLYMQTVSKPKAIACL